MKSLGTKTALFVLVRATSRAIAGAGEDIETNAVGCSFESSAQKISTC
jgi:hypothetical protein